MKWTLGLLVEYKSYPWNRGVRGGVVVKALRYKPAGRGFDSRWCPDFFKSHYGSGVDSASNRNEYQVYPGGKGGRCVRLTTYHHTVPLSRNLGTLTSWNALGLHGLSRECFTFTHERGRGIAREYYGSVVYGVTWLLYTYTIESGHLKFTLIKFKCSFFEVIKEKTEKAPE
jgi:hypothetical protein